MKKLNTPKNKILLSIIINIVVIAYYIYLGITTKDLFARSFSIYYVFIVIVKLFILLFLKEGKKANSKSFYKKAYMFLTIIMIVIDLSLIVPMFLMVLYPNEVKMGIIPAITIATYTTYKITIALIHFRKKSEDNAIIRFVKELSVVEAFVSILMLQHTLIMVNGEMNTDMRVLSSISSAIILSIVMLYSVINLIKTIKNN